MSLVPERRVGVGRQAAASAVVAVAAFAAYHGTLLPGLDLGDTASFQDAGGSREITPRQAYPLYFFLANIVVWLAGGEPAHGMNLASAISGAVACGLLTWLAIDLTGRATAGVVAGALFATSYTFWSQAVIAEVYALHVVMLAAALIALLAWGRRPASRGRLAAFFAIYALGFGNHLMMVLLAPAAMLFLATTMPGGLRALTAPRVVAIAVLCAAVGALQYAWNFQSLWTSPDPPPSLLEGLRTFWFDVTKSDWRRTMVLGVHEAALRPRLAMYAFDVRQQFGITGIALALLGTGALLRASWRTGAMLVTAWLVAVIFAYTYNVGDAHVFFIPSHVVVALAAGAGAGLIVEWGRRVPAASAVIAIVLLLYPAWRAYDTWPAVDRSGDRRAEALMADLAGGLPPERALLLADLNWQLQNALDYHGRHVDPSLAFAR
ncbi:MAG TPA: DUF2723 domain-containing protein, partial [Gemmatimonadales bacterium]|nr:DUF2723 domain-containing protein [Gemmatimonadales bacterium]